MQGQSSKSTNKATETHMSTKPRVRAVRSAAQSRPLTQGPAHRERARRETRPAQSEEGSIERCHAEEKDAVLLIARRLAHTDRGGLKDCAVG